jgi:cytochrome P450
MFHPLIRSVVKYFVPSIRRVWKHNKLAERLLTPILKQRNHDEKLPGYEKPNDTIEWIRDSLHGSDKDDYLFQAISQLSIGAVSIHTTSQMVTAVLYNLATYPEYIPILQQEARTVLAESNGIWTIDSMYSLRKLDSFMKESQRSDPSLIISFQRKTLKPIMLSSGLILPTHDHLFRIRSRLI